jgi:hypothetical protein
VHLKSQAHSSQGPVGTRCADSTNIPVSLHVRPQPYVFGSKAPLTSALVSALHYQRPCSCQTLGRGQLE